MSDSNLPSRDEFEREAQKASTGLFSEMGAFLRANKKWWLIPVVVALVLVGALVFLAGTAAAPFIYTLF